MITIEELVVFHTFELSIWVTALFRNESPSWIAPWSSPEAGYPHFGMPRAAALVASVPCMSRHWFGLTQTKFGTLPDARSCPSCL